MALQTDTQTRALSDVPHKETMQDLFLTANRNWNLSESEVRAAIKAAGYTKWDGMQWYTYLEVLRQFWLTKHIAEQEALGVKAMQTFQEKKAELLRREEGIRIVVEPDGWRFDGTEDQLAAHWELEDLLRRERVKQTRWRYSYGR